MLIKISYKKDFLVLLNVIEMSLILFLYNVYKLKKRIILCEFEKGAIESFKASFCKYS
jgi:hypothetical protein